MCINGRKYTILSRFYIYRSELLLLPKSAKNIQKSPNPVPLSKKPE